MSDASTYDYMKPFFEKQLAEIDPDLDDLGLSLYAEMTERMTPLQLPDAVTSDEAMRREIAFAIYRAQYLPARFLSQGDRALLDSTIAALVDPRVRLQLTFKRPSRGRQRTYVAFEQQFERERQVSQILAEAIEKGEKLEGAVASAAEKFGLARSTIFKIWQRRNEYAGRDAVANEIEAYFKPIHKAVISRLVERFRSFFRRG